MSARHVKWALLACVVIVFSSAPFAAQEVQRTGDVPHTVTWSCVDLNDLWHVDVPVIVGRALLTAPIPSPIPDPCPNSPFPVVVPAGSAVAIGNAFWYTNKTYPPAIRAALEARGYNFHSQNPAEDFMHKFASIRVEVKTFPGNELLQEFQFDPRKTFRLVRVREYYGLTPLTPLVDPSLGIDIGVEEFGRLPLLGMPVVVDTSALAPGEYRLFMYWSFSEEHNDGLGLDDFVNFAPAGESPSVSPRFIVQ